MGKYHGERLTEAGGFEDQRAIVVREHESSGRGNTFHIAALAMALCTRQIRTGAAQRSEHP